MAKTANFGFELLTDNASTGLMLMQLNRVLAQIDANLYFQDKGLTNTPPATPTQGDLYRIDDTPTGVWAGHSDESALWWASEWVYSDVSIDEMLGHIFWNPTKPVNERLLGRYQAGSTLRKFHMSAIIFTPMTDTITGPTQGEVADLQGSLNTYITRCQSAGLLGTP